MYWTRPLISMYWVYLCPSNLSLTYTILSVQIAVCIIFSLIPLHHFFTHSTSYYSEFTSVFVTDSQYHECISFATRPWQSVRRRVCRLTYWRRIRFRGGWPIRSWAISVTTFRFSNWKASTSVHIELAKDANPPWLTVLFPWCLLAWTHTTELQSHVCCWYISLHLQYSRACQGSQVTKAA